MSRSPPTPPSLKGIAVALQKTTRELARQLASPSAIRPDWNAFEWQVARAAAAIHGIGPLLSGRLQWDGVHGWSEFLEQQRRAVCERQGHIESLLARIDALAVESGVALTALKGVALHRLGICRSGDRPMADIDVLAGAQDLERISRLLERLDYVQTLVTRRHHMFQPVAGASDQAFGEAADAPIKIEVHTRVAERLPQTEVDITAALASSAAPAGVNDYRSSDALLLHLLLHAAGNMSSRWLRLLQLHDIALVVARMSSGDWTRLVAENIAAGWAWWMYPPLALTEQCFPATVPQEVLQALRPHCHRRLRRASRHYTIANVSGSHPWVSAAPALAWAKSPVEVTRYLRGRMFPPARERQLLDNYCRQQPWAGDGDWCSVPQGRRLLRWLFSRPGRQQILHAVRLAQQTSP